MTHNRTTLVLLAAGFCTPCLAQPAEELIHNDRAFPITIDQIQGGGYLRGYSQRADTEVYQIGTPAETGGVFAGSGTNVYDDCTFGNSYPSNNFPLALNGMSIGFVLPAAFPAINGDHLYTRVTFFPNHNNAAAATDTAYSGTPVTATNLDWGMGWTVGATPGAVRYYQNCITFGGTFATLSVADVFNGGAADRTCGVLIEPYNDAAFTIRANEYQVVRRAGFVGFKTGSGDTFGWYQATVPPIPNSARSGGGAFNPVYSTTAPTNSGGNCRATYMGFQGTNLGCEPGGCPWGELGCLPDAGSTTTTNVDTNSVRWFRFCLPFAASDSTLRYVDIDGENSVADVAMAVYDGSSQSTTFGNLIASDKNSGSGFNPMLSFGIGRRAAIGNGLQYDGRNMSSPLAAGLAAGTYYIAVAPNDSIFTDGFGVTPQGPGGTFSLNFRTNINGLPAAPSVRPLANLDLGQLSGDAAIPAVIFAPNDVFWVRLRTCLDAAPNRPVSIDLSGTNAPTSSLTLFNSSGNVVAQSISATSTPAAITLTSSLPAGDYDLAISHAAVQLAPSPSTNGRWHVRSTEAAAGFAFAGVVHVGWASCCGPSDFDGDGDAGTDADIEAFFACLGGNCCAACWPLGADFNNDGDSGTDADIESFFRVLGGGGC